MSDLLLHDGRLNRGSLHRTCFLVLAAGDTAQSVCVNKRHEKHPQRFLYHGSSYARGQTGDIPSELDENYIPLLFHGTMAVFDRSGRFHTVIPIVSGITLFPRVVHERDVPILTRWVEVSMARSLKTSIWVTDTGDSYNEQTLQCRPRLKTRV